MKMVFIAGAFNCGRVYSLWGNHIVGMFTCGWCESSLTCIYV